MKKQNGFLKGAAVLSIAGIIVKILGAMYRVPLSNIIKSEGMGYYQTAYPLYTLLLTISTAGFPVAIAKLVSEKRSIGDYESAHKVFKVALIGLAIFGGISSLFLGINAERIVANIGNSNAYYALISLAPALVFVPVMSVMRGFFQGSQNMVPTALSQIAEQSFRVFSGLFLTYALLDRGIPMAAGGASMGGTIGAFTGTIVVIGIYLKRREEINEERRNSLIVGEYPVSDIIKDLLKIAVPITLGAAIIPIMDSIDLKLVMQRLQLIGFTESYANDLYGNYKGMAQTLVNLPQVFAVAISVSLVPAISNAKAANDKGDLRDTITSGLRMTLLIGLPAALGLFILSEEIIRLLYYKNTAETIIITGNLLRVSALGVIFLTSVQSLSAILQGLGQPLIPAINLFVGAVIKTILTYTLTVIPSINIYGAAFSTVVAYGIAFILNLLAVIKYSEIKFDFKYIFKKPLISAIGMAIVVKLVYFSIGGIFRNSISTLISIAIGGVTYIILLLLTGGISDEDLKLLPKGDKIKIVIDKIKKK